MAPLCKSFKKAAACVAAFLGLFASLSAEEEGTAFLRFIPFSIQDVDPDEGNLIESLIESYLPNIAGLPVFREAPDDGAQPRYVVSGSISVENERPILTIHLEKLDAGEDLRRTAQYKNTGEMALNVHTVIEDCFYEGQAPTRTKPAH